jgi:hypothetical protein
VSEALQQIPIDEKLPSKELSSDLHVLPADDKLTEAEASSDLQRLPRDEELPAVEDAGDLQHLLTVDELTAVEVSEAQVKIPIHEELPAVDESEDSQHLPTDENFTAAEVPEAVQQTPTDETIPAAKVSGDMENLPTDEKLSAATASGDLTQLPMDENVPTAELSDEDTSSTVDTVGALDDASSEVADHDLKTRGTQQGPGIIDFLSRFGYEAENAATWCHPTALPSFSLKVKIHTESGGHTAYLIECRIDHCDSDAKEIVTWSALKRLKYLREDFHVVLKSQLGQKAYSYRFGATPFALRMGPPGTTARLNAWFESLSHCMSKGLLSPAIVAHVLESLDARDAASFRSTSSPS